jgi:hypothetical protein
MCPLAAQASSAAVAAARAAAAVGGALRAAAHAAGVRNGGGGHTPIPGLIYRARFLRPGTTFDTYLEVYDILYAAAMVHKTLQEMTRISDVYL